MIRAAALATLWTLIVCIVVGMVVVAWPLSGMVVLWMIFYMGAKS